mmetsp:Transcript_155770/g.378357  ORF Transcript_155770/g.378357 Transcript_155770/m.378357 type:complete len:318 (+) Transcript_155770:60-1013(+)
MGASYSVPLYVTDSIVDPGNPSIVSDPIEADFDAYCDQLVALLKYPVQPTYEAVLKTCAVTEGATPDDFEVKVILDPVKLQAVGYANPKDPSLERIEVHNKLHLDRAGRCLSNETYAPCWAGEEPTLLITAHATFTKDPFRIDYYWTLPDGSRKADELTLALLKPISDKVMAALADRKVVLKFDEATKSVSSGPIDEAVTTYEALFDGMVYCLKNSPQATVEEMTETQFKICSEGEQPYKVATIDKAQGGVTIDVFQADGSKKLFTIAFTFFKAPLSLEAWVDLDGQKQTGKGAARAMQVLVDGAVARASSWGFGIF